MCSIFWNFCVLKFWRKHSCKIGISPLLGYSSLAYLVSNDVTITSSLRIDVARVWYVFLSILLVLENCNFRSLKVLEKSLNFVLSVCYEPCKRDNRYVHEVLCLVLVSMCLNMYCNCIIFMVYCIAQVHISWYVKCWKYHICHYQMWSFKLQMHQNPFSAGPLP